MPQKSIQGVQRQTDETTTQENNVLEKKKVNIRKHNSHLNFPV